MPFLCNVYPDLSRITFNFSFVYFGIGTTPAAWLNKDFGTGQATKTDEFPEIFQTAFDIQCNINFWTENDQGPAPCQLAQGGSSGWSLSTAPQTADRPKSGWNGLDNRKTLVLCNGCYLLPLLFHPFQISFPSPHHSQEGDHKSSPPDPTPTS